MRRMTEREWTGYVIEVQMTLGVDLREKDPASGHPVWEIAFANGIIGPDWVVRPGTRHQDWADQQCGGCDNGECCEMDSCPACECDDA